MNTVDYATKQLCQRYIKNRFPSSVDEWPPYQPKHYTTLAFIHDKSKLVRFYVTQELAVAGNINTPQLYKHSNLNANMTKNISDIFLPVTASDGSFIDLHVLIEGAPGIGKTVLSKEIAYQWAKNKLMTSKRLILLVFLRECHHNSLKSVENLVEHVFATSKVTTCLTDYLLQTEGEDTVIIFDGFDELPEESRKKSIIIDIIHRRILTKSCLVITSRPTASSSLHGSVDRRVEIIGFTEEDRLEYIQTALQNHDEQIKDLQHYLQSNPTINALCYIPLNMTILLCLVEDGIDRLPKTQTEMYKRFIETTIIRFIKKYVNRDTIINITELPHPYDKLLTELANLAYEALKTDKIVFTLPEINKSCPNLTMTSSNWNGLGLLKAVQCYSKEIGNDQVTFHFLHFSIQEYMAAWYISTLSDKKQIKLLQKTFWEHRYYNTWIMYVGITGGSSFALRHFMSGNWFQLYSKVFGASKVSSKFLKHKMKCLHLFQCLVEAEKVDSMKQLDSVKRLFQNNEIDLSNQTLLPTDLNTLGFFLIRSINKEWDELNLSNCSIGSNGSNVLCDRLLDKDVRCIVTIKTVNFSYNQLDFSSLIRLFGLFNSWHTSEIIITDDASLGKITDQKIEDIVLQSSTLVLVHVTSWLFCKNAELSKIRHILSNTTNIESVYLLNCTWTYDSEVLTLLRKQKLNKVRIIGSFNLGLFLENNLIKTLASILLSSNNSVNMFVYSPTMPDQIADDICNLILSSDKDISGVMLIVSSGKVQGIVNTCSMSNELSVLEIFNLSRYIRYLNTKMCPWSLESNSDNKDVIFTFIKLLHKIDFDWKLKVLLWENNTLIVHNTKFKSFDKFKQFTNNNIYLSSCDVSEPQYDVISGTCSTLHTLNSPECVEMLHAKLSHKQFIPNELFIYGNINYKLMNSLIELLSHDHLNISAVLAVNGIIVGIHPNSELTALAFQLQPLPTTWILSTTDNRSVFYQVIDAISIIPVWIELDFTGCDIGDVDCEVVQRTFMNNNSSTVRKLNISFNKLSVSGIQDLTKIVLIWRVQKLNINGTNDDLLDCLIKNLTCMHQNSFFVSITYNHKILLVVCNKSWDEIVTKMNTHASELYIINCDLLLNTTGFIDYLHTVHNLLRLCITNGSVSATVAIKVFEFFSRETAEVSISNISITDDGEVIRNLLTARDFCLDAKFNLLVSTDHWLCVYNITKYQLHFIHKYFMNQTPPNYYGMTLIRKLEQLSRNKMYIFDNNLVYLLCMDGNIRDSIMNTAIEFTSHDDHKISAVLVSNNVVAGIYPNSEQIAAVFHLQPSPTAWIQYTAVSANVFYQIIDALSILHTTWAELDFTHCNIGDVECKIMLKSLRRNNSSSTVRKLSISLKKLSVSGIRDLVSIVSIWKVKELNISRTNDVLCDCLIKNLTNGSEHQGDVVLFVTYNHKISQIICNKSWNKITTIMNTQASELYIINCELQSEEIASYINTARNLLKVYVINGTISETVGIKVVKCFLDRNVILSISNVKVVDDDRMIRNFIISKEFYRDAKLRLMLSTRNWLCVYNVAKFQLHFIHQYFIDQSPDYCGMTLIKKFEQLNEDKMYIFDNSSVNLLFICGNLKDNLMNSSVEFTSYSDHEISAAANDAVGIHPSSKQISLVLHLQTSPTTWIQYIAVSVSIFYQIIDALSILHTKWAELDFTHCNITDVECEIMYKNLKLNHYSIVRKLNISLNKLSLSGIPDLVEIILLWRVQELNINESNNVLHNCLVKKLTKEHHRFSFLSITYNRKVIVCNTGWDKIATILNGQVSELYVINCILNSKELISYLETTYSLSRFCLIKGHISVAIVFEILKLDKVIEVSISNVKITDDNRIRNLITQRKFYLGIKSRLTISTAKWLYVHNIIKYQLPLIHQYFMSQAQSDSYGMSLVRKLEQINGDKMYVFDNNLLTVVCVHARVSQAPGATQIITALSDIVSLHTIEIDNYAITNETVNDLANILHHNTQLQELYLNGNCLHADTTIAKMLHSISTSSVCKIHITDDVAGNFTVTKTSITSAANLEASDSTTTIKAESLHSTRTLTKFSISNNRITDKTANDISAVISNNIHLQEVNLGYNNLQASGIIKIAGSLQKISSLTKLYINHNSITHEAADDIAAVISCNTSLQEVDISENDLQTRGAKKIAKSLRNVHVLEKLNLSNNNITGEAADDIAIAIFYCTKLQEIDISKNDLLTAGVQKIMRALQGINTLKKLCLSNNNITGEAAHDIATVVFCNTKLQEIDISENYLLTAGVQKIMKVLQGINTLKKLCLSNNNITGEAADDIAAVVSCNPHLEEFDISKNEIEGRGAIKLAKSFQKNSSLKKLFVDHNRITDEAADDFASVISHNPHLIAFKINENLLQNVKIIKTAFYASRNLTEIDI